MNISSHYYNKSIALYKFWNTKWLPMFSENSHGRIDDHENQFKTSDGESYFKSSDGLIDGFYNLLRSAPSKNIFQACRSGNIRDVKDFIYNNEFDLNSLNDKSETPLLIATFEGHEDIVNLLLRNKADVNAVNKNGESALYYASLCGRNNIVEILLKNKANVNLRNKFGQTALHIASSNKLNLESISSYIAKIITIFNRDGNIVELLLKNKADIDLKDGDGSAPLHYAIESNNKNIIELLIKNKADLNIKNKNGRTGLHLACGLKLKGIVELLVKNKVDTSIKDDNGQTALHLACSCNGKNDCMYRFACVDIVEILLKQNIDINIIDKKGYTALLIASEEGNTLLAELLLKNNAYVDKRKLTTVKYKGEENLKKGPTPLYMASKNGHFQIVDMLLKRGANKNDYENKGYTALYAAILNVNVTVVELLLNNKAETYFKFLNIHALHFACLVRNRDKLLKMEEEHKDVYSFAGSNKLHISIDPRFRNKEIIKLLTEERNQPFKYTNDEYIQSRYKDLVKLILEKGKKSVVNFADFNGNTPLDIAAYFGDKELAEILLKSKADVNLKNSIGQTPLHIAAICGSIEVADVLVKNKADLNLKDKEGQTAYALAIKAGWKKLADRLAVDIVY